MSNIRKQFGVRLYQLRTEAGMTQAKLAQKADLSLDLISRIERGDRSPSFDSIEKISDALKIPLVQLFNFRSEEITALAETSHESFELWRLLKDKQSKQVRKILDIAKIIFQ